MAPIHSAEEGASTCILCSAGLFATYAHGVVGLKILTALAQFSNIYCPGLMHQWWRGRTTLILIAKAQIHVMPVVERAIVLKFQK